LAIVVEEAGRPPRRLRLKHAGCRSGTEAPPLRAEIARYPAAGTALSSGAATWISTTCSRGSPSPAGNDAGPGRALCVPADDVPVPRGWRSTKKRRAPGRRTRAATTARRKSRASSNGCARASICANACPYPAQGAGKSFVLELGNHGHLHYDTAAAAAAENGWKSHAKMGAGRYPWLGADASSFGEQRDNILEAAGGASACWGSCRVPGRNRGAATTPTRRAAEAAGLEVLSRFRHPRARQRAVPAAAAHPGGTNAVELTSRYPPDPQHVHHTRCCGSGCTARGAWGGRWSSCAISTCASGRARSARASPNASSGPRWSIFRGNFSSTRFSASASIGASVLSPRTRRVTVALAGTRLVVDNRSDADFERVPVDLERA
jgi:hypothetical protein